MKIWELCNKIKRTDAKRETIRDWSIMNRICPLAFDYELPAKGKYKKTILRASRKCCEEHECGMGCLDEFLDTEVTI